MQIPRDKIRIFLIYVVLILLIIKFALLPTYQNLTKKKEDWQRLTKNYMTLVVLEKRDLKTDKLKEDPESLPYFLEDPPLVYSIILGIIKKLTEQRKLQLLHYEIIEAKKEGKFEELPLLIKIAGKPVQVYEFLKDLSEHPKMLHVKSLEIIETGHSYEIILNIVAFRIASEETNINTSSIRKNERKNL